jgi:hypothetical protein
VAACVVTCPPLSSRSFHVFTMPGAFSFSLLSFLFLFALESSAVQLSIHRPPPKAASDVNNNLINSDNLRVSRPAGGITCAETGAAV